MGPPVPCENGLAHHIITVRGAVTASTWHDCQGIRGARWCRMSSGRLIRRNRMNVRHLVPSLSRGLLSMGSLMLAAGLQHATGADLSKFRILIEPQYIAALGEPGATSGNDAQSWGVWSQDPGPRG